MNKKIIVAEDEKILKKMIDKWNEVYPQIVGSDDIMFNLNK